MTLVICYTLDTVKRGEILNETYKDYEQCSCTY